MRGSVRKRGSSWAIVYDEGRDPVTGKRQQRWKSGFRTRLDAERALSKTVTSVQDGTYVRPTDQTVAELLDEWLEVRRSKLRPGTWATYRRYIDVHVVPAIGAMKLQSLDAGHLERLYADLLAAGRRPAREGRPAEVAATAQALKAQGHTWQEVADRLAKEVPEHGPYTRHSVAAMVRRREEAEPNRSRSAGLGPTTVRNVHVIVKAALRQAVRWQRIARNPAEFVDPPSPARKRQVKAWPAEVLAEFLDRAQADDDRHAALWTFVATTGMRRGEVLGLRWSDLDLEDGSATIVQTIVAVAHAPVVSEPKTDAGHRRVALDAHTVDVLRRHRTTQLEERLRLGAGFTDHGLVFCAVDGAPLHPERVSREFDRRVERWGLPRIPLHGLRHTWATLAMRAGVPARVVQERLGHSHVSVTLGIYSHVQPGQDAEAAELVAGMLRR